MLAPELLTEKRHTGDKRMNFRVLGIAKKPARNMPMTFVDEVCITPEHGIEGDIHGTSKRRQLTVLSLPQWEEVCREVQAALLWFVRRANLCVSTIRFTSPDVGRELYIGETIILEITGEATPCLRMEQTFAGLKNALHSFRGGVSCRVKRGGVLSRGDIVIKL